MATVQAQTFRLRRTQYSRQPWHASTTFLTEKRPMRGVESKAPPRVTSSLQRPQTRWSLEGLTALCQRQARVRMAGWLLHDFPYVKNVSISRASAWEIHPVTSIEVWEPDQQVWQALPWGIKTPVATL